MTRFAADADVDAKRKFARELVAALDRLGVKPGEEFIIARAQDAEAGGKLYQVESPDASALGPFRSDASEESRKAAVLNYPRSGTQRNRILHHLYDHRSGRTRSELIRELGISQSSCHPRVLELIEGEWAAETDEVRPTETGADAKVIAITDKGIEAVNGERHAVRA